MYQLIMIIHVLAAAALILLVLVQQGKGATVGAAFGSGASQTVFGSRGSGSFLLKLTIGLVVVFFATSIALNRIATQQARAANQVSLPVNLPMAPSAAPAPAPAATPAAEVTPKNIPNSVPADEKSGVKK